MKKQQAQPHTREEVCPELDCLQVSCQGGVIEYAAAVSDGEGEEIGRIDL